MRQLTVDKHVRAGLNLSRVVCRRAITDASVPLCFLPPGAIGIFVALGCGNRKPRNAFAVLTCVCACILTDVTTKSNAIDIHKNLFLSEIECWVSLIANTPA